MPKKIILHYTKRRRYKDYLQLSQSLQEVSRGAELAIESLKQYAGTMDLFSKSYQQLKDKSQ